MLQRARLCLLLCAALLLPLQASAGTDPSGSFRIYQLGIPLAELLISSQTGDAQGTATPEFRFEFSQRDRNTGAWRASQVFDADRQDDLAKLPPDLRGLISSLSKLAKIDFTPLDAVGWPNAETIYLRNGEVTAEASGPSLAAIWFAERDATHPLDLLIGTDGRWIGAVAPSREIVIVRRGFEALTGVSAWRDAGVSQAIYGLGESQRFDVAMKDGARLVTLVHLPVALEGKSTSTLPPSWPTILVRTPYGLNDLIERYWQHVARGYAVVLQSTRGRTYWDPGHRSEGDWQMMVDEPADGADTLDWITRQPWSDGRIGMQGGSYVGYTQWTATIADNPALQCIIPEVSMGTAFSDQPFMGGGFVSGLTYYVFWMLNKKLLEGRSWAEVLRHRPLIEIDSFATGEDLEVWNRLLSNWRNADYWQGQDWYNKDLERNFSSFQISGWFDDDFPGTRANWALVQNGSGARPHRLLIGPWKHGYNVDRSLNGFSFGSDAIRGDIGLLKQQWYDQCFGRSAQPTENRVDYFVLGDNLWRDSTTWPPEEAVERRFYLKSSGRAASLTTDGTLVREPPSGDSSSDTWVYDPSDPPTNWMAFEQMDSWADVQSFPHDFRDLERRHDVATYTTSPFEESLTLAGDIHLVLEASTDVKDTDWWAHVSDVYPDGRSVRLSVGLIRARFRHLDDKREHIRGQNYATEVLLSGDPNDVVRYEIALPSIANTFKKGHRLRIAIANAWDNYSFPNSNTGGDEATATGTVEGTMTVHHDKAHPSYVLISVLP